MSRKPRGWHPEDIKAAVRKKGTTLTALALANKLPESACRVALRMPYYIGEQAISRFLGISPRTLWPDRYDEDAQPLQPRIRAKITSGRVASQCQKRVAA
jgi:Ner family transcriptional regulator